MAGLAEEEAARRLREAGLNEIARGEATSPWKILAAQFASPLIGLPLAASVLSGLLGEVADAAAIGAILVVNAFVASSRSTAPRRPCSPRAGDGVGSDEAGAPPPPGPDAEAVRDAVVRG